MLDKTPTTTQRRWLRTPEAAEHVGLGASTLEKYRVVGGGPLYRKVGRVVIYDIADLDAWASADKRTSTSDPGEEAAA